MRRSGLLPALPPALLFALLLVPTAYGCASSSSPAASPVTAEMDGPSVEEDGPLYWPPLEVAPDYSAWDHLVALGEIDTPHDDNGGLWRLLAAVEAFGRVPAAVRGEATDAWLYNDRMLTPELRPLTTEPLDALVDWYSAGGGIGDDPCLTELNGAAVALSGLARMALMASEPQPDSEALRAALALGRALRRQGRYMHSAAGVGIFADAVDWADVRGVIPDQQFVDYRLQHVEVVPMVAREWSCAHRFAERQFEGQWDTKAAQLSGGAPTRSLKEELALIRDVVGQRVYMMTQQSTDLDWISRYADFTTLPEVGQAPLMRLLAVDMRALADTAGLALERWQTLYVEGPPGVAIE